jgi:hypothetical protein
MISYRSEKCFNALKIRVALCLSITRGIARGLLKRKAEKAAAAQNASWFHFAGQADKKIDSVVFNDVYDLIQKWFSSMIYTSVEDEFMDIIDEAMTRFIEKGREFRGNSVGEFYNYMRTVIRNIIADQARIAPGSVTVKSVMK